MSSPTQFFNSPIGKSDTQIILHDLLKYHIANSLHPKLSEYKFTLVDIYNLLETPPNQEIGDLALPCFTISKQLRKSPSDVAKQLLDIANSIPAKNFTVSSTGAYLNFSLDPELLVELVLKPILANKTFTDKIILNASKCVVEYSQPNTHKELHVGHMRNMCFGLALANILKYLGFNIITATFPGDVGTHVAKCLWYLKKYCQEDPPTSNKGAWLGSIYPKAVKLYDGQQNSSAKINNDQSLAEILRQLEQHSGEYYELWKETRLWSIEQLEEVYRWAGITFDKWYWESDVDSQSVQLIKKLFQEGKVTESDGALGINLENQNLGFCMLLKADGNGLYATKDLLLAQRKFEDYHADKSIVIVDLRQTYHFQQVFTCLGLIGFEHAKDCYHLPYNYVELPDGAMSSRKGNIIPLNTLIANMEKSIIEKYFSDDANRIDKNALESTAKLIAEAAIKFGMNASEPMTKLVFDMDSWLRLDTQSGPYVQYTCVRIKSVINKASITTNHNIDLNLLTSSIEKQLILKLAEFNTQVVAVASKLKTNLLCTYLLDVCRIYNRFYSENKIIVPDNHELTMARVSLCRATVNILESGLKLLGIEVPERM